MKTLQNDSDKNALIARVKELSPGSKAIWGKMNANQMMCHLTDQMRHAIGERDNPDMSNLFFRTVGKWLVINVVPVPKNIRTAPRVDQMIGGTKPTDFESDRETLVSYVKKMASLPDDFEWGPHFRFGAMNKKEWCALTHKHADHHLRQFGV